MYRIFYNLNISLNHPGLITINIVNSIGTLVMSFEADGSVDISRVIDFTKTEAGIFWMQIKAGDLFYFKKILVVK